MLTFTLFTTIVCIGVGILLINTLLCLPTAIGRREIPWVVLILLTGPIAAFCFSLRKDDELKWLGKLSLWGLAIALAGAAALLVTLLLHPR
ncbi:hypothetical protein [Jeongeupia naejangsanensis]|uniref:Uncharacterized protein n=1 Tax=Jeongeupia naejangsanensis TaxID=613195 RepID=A0ABS2BLS3_9NEIS|nr:hypothetical protein [Jeongeupia naejangsanensis]MBM3115729.1 hypothetical protein [Jeongeupia naejangsanensis]